jgi:CheY-like chemotaxis protein
MRVKLFHNRFDLTCPDPVIPAKRELNKVVDDIKLYKLITSIQDLIGISSELSGKIALIDDDGSITFDNCDYDLGWTSALNHLLCRPLVVDVLKQTGVTFKEEQEFDANIKKIIQHIDLIQPACILLDIRLSRAENDTNYVGKHLSGEVLLKKLRNSFPTLPIIVFASTSITSNQHKYRNFGADAVWIKEGVDQENSVQKLYINILHLLELIQRVCGKEYQYLSRLGKITRDIEKACKQNRITYWWQQNEYPQWLHLKGGPFDRFAISSSSRNKIQDYLPGLMHEMRTLLQGKAQQLLHFDANAPLGNRYHMNADSLLVQMAKVIELIHGVDLLSGHDSQVNSTVIGAKKGSDGKVTVIRGDWFAYALYKLRNQSAHFSSGAQFNFDLDDPKNTRSLGYFLAHFMAYLTNPNQSFSSNSFDDYPNRSDSSEILPANYFDKLINRNRNSPSIRSHQKNYKNLFQA